MKIKGSLKLFFTYLVVFLVLSVNGCTGDHRDNAKLSGMWRLDHFEYLKEPGKTWETDTDRTGYLGYLLYDGDKNMAIHLQPPVYVGEADLITDVDSLSADDLKQQLKLMRKNYVYFANYVIEGNEVKHTKLSATDPAEAGSIAIREFKADNDTLWLTTKEKVKGKKLRLKWIKLK